MAPAIQPSVFRFGGFMLVPRERRLLHGLQPVRLPPKAFDLLVALIRHPNRLLTKDELLRIVWPDSVVEEVNLTVNVSVIRKALQVEPGAGEWIETVPKHGYRFSAAVSVEPAPDIHGATDRSPFTIARPEIPGEPSSASPPDAELAYLRGRFHWSKRTERSLLEAIDEFERAVRSDPGFAAAHAGLSDAYATLGFLSHLAPVASFPIARRHAERALELDPSLAEPHASLGYVKLYHDWDWADAEVEFVRAVELNPGYPTAHHWYSVYLLAAGRPDEGLDEIQLAHRLDPLSVAIITDIGFHHYYNRRYARAIEQLTTALAMNPHFPPAHLWLGRTYQELGRFDAACAAFLQVAQAIPDWPVAIAARGFVHGVAGRTAEALSDLDQLKSLSRHRYVTAYGFALVHAGLGQTELAFEWLGKAFDERSHWLVWLRLDPRWHCLQSDPRFARLVDRMRFPP